MKKLNISFIDNGVKEDAILKIKDDSLSITTSDNSIIKIPYNDIKDYEYTQDEQLILKRKHSSDIVIEVSFDVTLINTLKEAVKANAVSRENLKPQDISELQKPIESKEAVEPVKENTANTYQQNTNQNNTGKIIGGIIGFIGVILFSYYITGVVTGDITNMNGCYNIDDPIISKTSLCFDGSKVTYSYYDASTTLNVQKIDNSVYIKNEYDEYMFTCEISSNDSNRMKCESYNEALGRGSYYFEKE